MVSGAPPDPTTRGTTGWTIEAVKELLESIIERNDRRYQERFDATEAAIKKADAATEKRFEGVNEFRSTLSDQQRTFIPRPEADVRIGELHGKIEQVKVQAIAESAAIRAERAQLYGGLKDELSRLASQYDQAVAAREGTKDGMARIIAVVGVIGTVLGIVMTLMLLYQRGQ